MSEEKKAAAPPQAAKRSCAQWFVMLRPELDAELGGQADFLFEAAKVRNGWSFRDWGCRPSIERLTDAGASMSEAEFRAGMARADKLA